MMVHIHAGKDSLLGWAECSHSVLKEEKVPPPSLALPGRPPSRAAADYLIRQDPQRWEDYR